MAKIKAVGKDHKNEMQNYKFRSIDDVYNACNKALSDEKITVEPNYEVISNEVTQEKTNYQGKEKIKNIRSVVLKAKYKFIADDGSFIEASSIGEAIDFSDKAFNKAMSQAFKYVLFQVFMIPTEEEKDTEFQNNQIPPKQKEEQKTQPEQKKECPPEIVEIKQKITAVLKKLGVKEDFMHGEIMKAQNALGIKGKIEAFSQEEWEKIFFHFTNVLKD